MTDDYDELDLGDLAGDTHQEVLQLHAKVDRLEREVRNLRGIARRILKAVEPPHEAAAPDDEGDEDGPGADAD